MVVKPSNCLRPRAMASGPRAVGCRRRLSALGTSGLLVLLAVPASAGPWTQPRGDSYCRFSFSYLYTRTEFDARGEEVPILTSNPLVRSAAYREVAVSSYVEYGVRDRLTLVASLPFKILTSQRTELSTDASLVREVDVTNAGLADLWVGVRRAIHRGRFPVAVEIGGKAPLGYDRTPDNFGPALGTGYADAEFAALAGFGARSVYASTRVAYRVLGGDLDNAVGFALEAGGHHERVFAQFLFEAWRSTGEIRELDVSSTAVVPNQDVTKLIVTAGARVNGRVALTVEAYSMLAGKNVATGTTAAMALILTP